MPSLQGGENFLDASRKTDSVRWYLQQIGKYPLLKSEEEVQLSRSVRAMVALKDRRQLLIEELKREPSAEEWAVAVGLEKVELTRQLRLGERSREKMIKANLRLVVHIATRYQKRRLDLLELIQEGTLGLDSAVQKFDPGKGYKFSTYAYWWIRQAITRGLAVKSRTIRLPVHVGEKLNKLKKISSKLAQQKGRTPTTREIAAAYLELPPGSEKEGTMKTVVANFRSGTWDKETCIKKISEEITRLREINFEPASLNLAINGKDDDTELGEFIRNGIDIQQELEERLFREEVQRQVDASLSGRERDVIYLRFGLEDGVPRSLREVGKMYDLSRERIRQVEEKALRKLRLSLSKLQSAI